MSLLKNAQHRLGFHAGDWTFDRERACEQTRNCNGCSAVSTRIRHELAGWSYRIPRETNECTKQRGCRRCAFTETRQEHSFEWYYYSEAKQQSGFLAAVALAHTRTTHPCHQFSACSHCGERGDGGRTQHQWERHLCVRCGAVDHHARQVGSL